LPAPARPQKHEEFALARLQVDAVDRGVLLEDLADRLRLDRRHETPLESDFVKKGEASLKKLPPGTQVAREKPPSRGGLEQLPLLPLGEDVPRLRLGFLDRVLGAHHALRRL